MENEPQKIAEDRLLVFEKIKQNEMFGGENYFNDVENDPPAKTLMPEDVDYLKKKLSSKFKNWYCKKIITKINFFLWFFLIYESNLPTVPFR